MYTAFQKMTVYPPSITHYTFLTTWTLKMEAATSSKTSVTNKQTLCHISEDINIQQKVILLDPLIFLGKDVSAI
jgi:hypothetical protein